MSQLKRYRELGFDVDEVNGRLGSVSAFENLYLPFIEEMKVRLEKIKRAVECDDFMAVKSNLHSLKGLFSGIGHNELYTITVELYEEITSVFGQSQNGNGNNVLLDLEYNKKSEQYIKFCSEKLILFEKIYGTVSQQ